MFSIQANKEMFETLKKIALTFLTALPAIILTFVFMSRGHVPQSGIKLAAFATGFIFFNSMFFMMLYTGKTDRYRSAIYIATAVFFVISFISHMFEARGSMSFTDDTLLNCEIPFCHIVTTMALIPYALTNTIIFPGSLVEGYAAIGSMIVIWLLACFTIGRGWCSWGCFFGGLDEGFSKILKKPVIKEINPKLKYAPFIVLLFVAVTSAYFLQPTYCSWLCPFKTVTEYEPITDAASIIKTIIFLSLFAALVIIFPLLTKKRTQCSLFCPFGAMQSATNCISPFEIKIDAAKCVGCKLCIKTCPTLSISENNLKKGSAGLTCVRCGKCVDVCPKGAAAYHIKGTVENFGGASRVVALYAFFLFMAIFLGGDFIGGVERLLKFITTGSFI